MNLSLAKDGEVGLVYVMDGRSYAVALSREQHLLLQVLVQSLGKIHVAKSAEVQFVKDPDQSITQNG